MQTLPLIIFDIDGTLTNTVEVDDLCYTSTFKNLHGIALSKIEWNNFPHVTDLGVCKSIFETMLDQNLTDEILAETKAYFFDQLKTMASDDPTLFIEVAGANAFVNRLRLHNFPIAIATGGWEESAKFKLDNIGFDYKNLPFANSDHHYSRKEITEIAIKFAREHYNSDFTKIVYFGDGEWDFKTCGELGIEFIGIDNQNTGKLNDLGAKIVFENFFNTEQLIEAIMD